MSNEIIILGGSIAVTFVTVYAVMSGSPGSEKFSTIEEESIDSDGNKIITKKKYKSMDCRKSIKRSLKRKVVDNNANWF